MLQSEQIELNYNSELLTLSPLVIRDIKDKTDDGEVIYEPELQFQVRNTSNKNIVDLEVELNYFDLSNNFIGTDNDLRLEPLSKGDVETFSLFINPPNAVVKAELKIKAKSESAFAVLNTIFHHPLLLIILIGLILYSNVKD